MFISRGFQDCIICIHEVPIIQCCTMALATSSTNAELCLAAAIAQQIMLLKFDM